MFDVLWQISVTHQKAKVRRDTINNLKLKSEEKCCTLVNLKEHKNYVDWNSVKGINREYRPV